MLPTFLTHYYHDLPFRCLTDLPTHEMVQDISKMQSKRLVPRRLMRPIYFMERRRYERKMREQFMAKGGKPVRRNPHYMVLGESDIWARQHPKSIKIPLLEMPSDIVSFTYTDSWYAYVDFDLNRRPVPRKPQYEMVYRCDELVDLIGEFGWPGDRAESGTSCSHDYYIEAQVWADEPLLPFTPEFEREQPVPITSTRAG